MNTTTCRAGFAQLDITPPLGVHLDGYFAFRPAKGVLDPLFVRAIAFGDGERTAVLLVCDLVGIYGTAAYEWPPCNLKNRLFSEPVFCIHFSSF